MVSLTEQAKALGYQCSVRMSSTLAARVDIHDVLARVLAAVRATTSDPQLENLRGVVLRGELPARSPRMPDWLEDYRQFIARAQAGIGGISSNGNLMALAVTGKHGMVMALVHIGYKPPHGIIAPHRAVPRIIINDIDSVISPGMTIVF